MNAQIETNMHTEPAIHFEGVCKAYPDFALRDVNLRLEPGTVAGLIGPNGAGKSTTMRILMGLVKPDRGLVSVLGTKISSKEATAKHDIGYFSDDMRLYKAETFGWHMQFVQSLYPSWDPIYASQLVQRFGLSENQLIKGLSHGQRVKAMLLLVLARRPKLIVLDEPTDGLDPVAKHEILSELMRIVENPERTLLYSSHNTQDIEQISDTITFIDRGRVIASHDRDTFLEMWKRIKIHVDESWQMPPIAGVRLDSTFRSLRTLTTDQYDESIPARLIASGAVIESVDPMTLEEIFVSSVMRGREKGHL